jgi:hypothetical protein
MRHIFEHFVVEERGERGRPFGIAGRADTALATREGEQFFRMARITTKPCEATFRRGAVEVTSHCRIGEAAPETVGFLEAVLPQRLELLVASLDQEK